MATIGEAIKTYDQLNIKARTPAEDIQLNNLKTNLINANVHSKWLEFNLSRSRIDLERRDKPLANYIYNNGFNDPNVYLTEPQNYNIALLNEWIYSPRLFFKRRIKKPLARAGYATLFGSALFTNPLAAAGMAAVFPIARMADEYDTYLIRTYFRLQPYLKPGEWLEDAVKRMQRRLIISVIPGVIGKAPGLISPKLALFKTYIEPTENGGLLTSTAFRPTHGFKLAVADMIGKSNSQVRQNIARRLRTRDKFDRRKSLLAALTAYLVAEYAIAAVKRLLTKKGLALATKVVRPLRFLKRGRALFSINAASGVLVGAGLGSAVGQPLLGALGGWGVGGAYQLYRNLATDPKFLLEYQKINRMYSRIGYWRSIGRAEWQTLGGRFRYRLYQARKLLYKPADLMARHRALRLPIKGGLLGYGLYSLGIVNAPTAVGIAGGWWAWNDLRPALQQFGAKGIVRRLLGKRIVADLNLGIAPNKVSLTHFNTWMRIKHPYSLRLFRALPSGGIAGVLAGGAAAVLGVPVPIAAGIGAGVGTGVTAINFGIRALHWRFIGSKSATAAAKFGKFGLLKFGGKAIPGVGWGAAAAEAFYGAETGTVFGFKGIPGTNISFSGPAGKVMNFGITVGSGAAIGTMFAPGVGTLIGAGVGAVVYGINEAVIALTGKSLTTLGKQGLVWLWNHGGKNVVLGIRDQLVHSPNSVKIGAAVGAIAGGATGGPIGALVGGTVGATVGWVVHVTGIDAAIAAAWNWAGEQPVLGTIVSGIEAAGSALLGGLRTVGSRIADFFRGAANRVIDPIADFATKIAAAAVNIIVAFLTGILALLSGGDIAQAAVSVAMGLILILAILAGQVPDESAAAAFLSLTKSANPDHIENVDLPRIISFDITLEAKDKPLLDVRCDDTLTTAIGSFPQSIPCPTNLAANDTFQHTITYNAPNDLRLHDSRIVNQIMVDFDVDMTPPPGDNVPPNADNCGGLYTFTSPLDNFGDPNCNYSDSDLYDLLQQLDPQYADFWFFTVVPSETVDRNDGQMDPNSYNPNSTAGQAFGLFQMGHAAYPQHGLDYQIADPGTEFDRGDVEWHVQTSNAINYNNQIIGGSFAYWPYGRP